MPMLPLAEEAHHLGEPCWHVCQYYERERLLRIERAHQRAARRKPRHNPVMEALRRDRENYFKGTGIFV